MMAHLADPSGNFDTDTHRRVQGHLPVPDDDPITSTALLVRLQQDPHTPVNTSEELTEILADLESDEYASQTDGDWKQTQAGFDLLTGPNSSDLED